MRAAAICAALVLLAGCGSTREVTVPQLERVVCPPILPPAVERCAEFENREARTMSFEQLEAAYGEARADHFSCWSALRVFRLSYERCKDRAAD